MEKIKLSFEIRNIKCMLSWKILKTKPIKISKNILKTTVSAIVSVFRKRNHPLSRHSLLFERNEVRPIMSNSNVSSRFILYCNRISAFSTTYCINNIVLNILRMRSGDSFFLKKNVSYFTPWKTCWMLVNGIVNIFVSTQNRIK